MEQKLQSDVNGLSVIRVIAILGVVMVHFGQSLPLPEIISQFVVFGQNGVTLFFIISGYLIAFSLSRESDIRRYFKKRLIRIIPAYWFVVIVSMVAINLISEPPSDPLKLGWIRYFLFLQTLLPSNKYELWNNCSALWTMSAFAVFYILAPLLVHIMRKGHKWTLLFGSVIVSIIVSKIYMFFPVSSELIDSMHYLAGHSPFVVLYQFVIGMIIFQLQTEMRQQLNDNRGGY